MKKSVSWADITVGQFMDLHRLSLNSELDEMEKSGQAICIIYDLTERQVEEMRMDDFNRLARGAAIFLTEPIPGRAVRLLKINSRPRYQICYDPSQLELRQYVEIMTYGAEPILNMNLIMASVVRPLNWYGRPLRNQVEDHGRVASDLLNARVVDVYHASVFFCNLYINSIENMRDYLVQEIMRNGNQTRREAEAAVQISINAMAGYIPQHELRSINVAP